MSEPFSKSFGAGADPLAAARRVDDISTPMRPKIAVVDKSAADAAAAAIEQSLAGVDSLSAVDLRNIRHARILNSVLQTMIEFKRGHFTPEDIGQIYVMTNAIDEIAGISAGPLPAYFIDRSPTKKSTTETERRQHDAPPSEEAPK